MTASVLRMMWIKSEPNMANGISLGGAAAAGYLPSPQVDLNQARSSRTIYFVQRASTGALLMNKRTLFGTVFAIAILGAISSPASPASAPPAGAPRGPGMMDGYGMMSPWMIGPGMMSGYGPGMMGPGMIAPGMIGPGMMGPGMTGWLWNRPALNLSTDDVKSYFENWLVLSGNAHIKVGTVAQKDETTITADIVTTDKEGLVQRFDVDRRTGLFYPARS